MRDRGVEDKGIEERNVWRRERDGGDEREMERIVGWMQYSRWAPAG